MSGIAGQCDEGDNQGEPMGQDTELGKALEAMASKVATLIESVQQASVNSGSPKLAMVQA